MLRIALADCAATVVPSLNEGAAEASTDQSTFRSAGIRAVMAAGEERGGALQADLAQPVAAAKLADGRPPAGGPQPYRQAADKVCGGLWDRWVAAGAALASSAAPMLAGTSRTCDGGGRRCLDAAT